jgi:integrase
MPTTIKFTEARVATLRAEVTSGRVEYQDELVQALWLRVSPSSASWYVIKRIPGGKRQRVLLGRADEISVSAARAESQKVIGRLMAGQDVLAEKRARKATTARESLTLREGLEIYLAERDKLRPATKLTYERDLRTTFGDYMDRPLVELTPEHVRDRHKDRKTRPMRAQAEVGHARDRKRITASPSRADGAVRALRAVVNYLRAERDLDLPDVARRITATKGWGNVARRKRALLGEPLGEFVSAVRALREDLPPDLTGTQRDLTLLLLCTGLRWSSGAGLQWSEIDFKAKTMTIPADRMKGKVEHCLPIGPAMMTMLKKRQEHARSKEFVFPGLEINPGNGKKKKMRPIARLSQRFLAKIKDADGVMIAWSPHDLRRTALTILESMDVSAYALKRIAAHSQIADVTAGYLADDAGRLRSPMERLEAVVFNGKSESNVVPIQRDSGRRR